MLFKSKPLPAFLDPVEKKVRAKADLFSKHVADVLRILGINAVDETSFLTSAGMQLRTAIRRELTTNVADAIQESALYGGINVVNPTYNPIITPDFKPEIELPLIKAAEEDLASRQVMNRDDFDRLSSSAKREAFTVATVQSEATLKQLLDALAEATKEGMTLRQFTDKASEIVADSPLSPAHMETVYRTNMMAGYAAGMKKVLSHPLVDNLFPYLQYSATHDGRVREEHLAMESLGLDGTAIYRKDDPIWERFFPPWGYNCRCRTIPLTKRDAAKKGVQEAIGWVASGVAPVSPAWVISPPFSPPDGWSTMQLF